MRKGWIGVLACVAWLAGCSSPTAGGGSTSSGNSNASAQRGLPRTAGIPILFGDTVPQVQAALQTAIRPEPYLSVNSKGEREDRGEQQLRLTSAGVWVFFNREGRVRTIRLDRPFVGSVADVRIGDTQADLFSKLGNPTRAALPAGLADSVRKALEEASRNENLYPIDSLYSARFDIGPAGTVTTVFLLPRSPSAATVAVGQPSGFPAPVPTPLTRVSNSSSLGADCERDAVARKLAGAAKDSFLRKCLNPPAGASPGMTVAPAGQCQDPFLEQGRFRVTDLEITDSRTSLVWFRCPALWVGKSGTCDSAMVLPSETWSTAVQVPSWAVKRPTPWRLASPDELDTIAAKGCGYLTNPKFIEIMFDAVWTRATASGDKVWMYGMDRQRKESVKQSAKANELFGQTIYVRNAP